MAMKIYDLDSAIGELSNNFYPNIKEVLPLLINYKAWRSGSYTPEQEGTPGAHRFFLQSLEAAKKVALLNPSEITLIDLLISTALMYLYRKPFGVARFNIIHSLSTPKLKEFLDNNKEYIELILKKVREANNRDSPEKANKRSSINKIIQEDTDMAEPTPKNHRWKEETSTTYVCNLCDFITTIKDEMVNHQSTRHPRVISAAGFNYKSPHKYPQTVSVRLENGDLGLYTFYKVCGESNLGEYLKETLEGLPSYKNPITLSKIGDELVKLIETSGVTPLCFHSNIPHDISPDLCPEDGECIYSAICFLRRTLKRKSKEHSYDLCDLEEPYVPEPRKTKPQEPKKRCPKAEG